MKHKLIVRVATAALMFGVAPALAAPPTGFDARVEALRKQVGVPGMAISIVEQGQPTLVKGYGVRKLGDAAAVDADTIFPTGSTGKAVTAAALALLVDQGRITWDDPVIKHIPWFQMYDPWVTREITVRDLLVHRSGLGLGAGDLLFVPRASLSRRETVKRLRHIKPATSFRSGYAYDNILYMVAGQLIEEVTGQTWEAFTNEHVLKRAGMQESTADGEARFATANRAFPHARMNSGLRGAGDQEVLNERDELGRNAAPAGGIAMSASDMALWLQIQLGKGKLPGGDARLYSEAVARDMWTPATLMPVSKMPPAFKDAEPMFKTYALGWDVSDYQGVRIISHGGAVFGVQTVVVLIPDRDVGFAIQINCEDGEIVRGLMYELIDHYLGRPAAGWPEKWVAFKKDRIAAGLKAFSAKSAEPARVGPSLSLARYAGDYDDPWYGRIEVRPAGKGLTIDFKSTPRMAGKLEHWQYDTFITRFDDKTIEPAYVTFGLDADGKVERVTMKAASPLADFSYDYHDLHFAPAAAAK
ncbi:serine hydrolase [Sphingomonas sp. LaA6.9]|uniref:serine hydrolase n=1 Tax=Sphingomonas sp. LaA6.9 TaxID=2919914 RepID=UPI001F500797|nr:serine hydrolase [Sphingomonas sp. LaA6.9]MCJ8158460.1 serine hydrolase [Sphingomonas sp. LaA6.9]